MNLEEVSCLPIKTKRLICNLMRKTAVCPSKAEVIYFDEKVRFFCALKIIRLCIFLGEVSCLPIKNQGITYFVKEISCLRKPCFMYCDAEISWLSIKT